MYLVLYCHNIGMTDFSFFETEDFDKEECWETNERDSYRKLRGFAY